MQLLFTFRHMDATEALKKRVGQKAARLEKYLEKESEIHAILHTERHSQHIELVIHAPGPTLAVEQSSDDMYTAIDLVMDKAERLLVRRKEKLKNHGAS